MRLSTDFWPWPEVLADLSQRPALSAVLEVRHQDRCARAYWSDGQALGGHSGPEDTELNALTRAFPRAAVSLLLLDPETASVAWACRHIPREPASEPWSHLQPTLRARRFSGIISGESTTSYWQAGVRLSGSEPQPDEYATVIPAPFEVLSNEQVITFYTAVLAVAAQHFNVEPHWRASCLELADDHLCLDPFAREVLLEQGRLVLRADIEAEELLAALSAALTATLARAGRQARDLNLDALHQHPVWPRSGLNPA